MISREKIVFFKCIYFFNLGTKIISGSLDSTIKLWDLETGLCSRTLDWMTSEGHTGVIRCLQADSWRIVSSSDDKTLKVWELETGQRLVTLRCDIFFFVKMISWNKN